MFVELCFDSRPALVAGPEGKHAAQAELIKRLRNSRCDRIVERIAHKHVVRRGDTAPQHLNPRQKRAQISLVTIHVRIDLANQDVDPFPQREVAGDAGDQAFGEVAMHVDETGADNVVWPAANVSVGVLGSELGKRANGDNRVTLHKHRAIAKWFRGQNPAAPDQCRAHITTLGKTAASFGLRNPPFTQPIDGFPSRYTKRDRGTQKVDRWPLLAACNDVAARTVTFVRRWTLLVILTLAAGAILDVAGLPTPWLFGGLAGGLTYALASPSSPLELPALAFRGGQAVVGAIVGASIEWQRLAELRTQWAVIVLVGVFSLIVSVSLGRALIGRSVSPITATFSSIAGGAAGLTAMADDLGADARTVAVLQYLRLLMVLLLMPIVVTAVFNADVVVAEQIDTTSWLTDFAFVTITITLGLFIGRQFRLPSPAILGPMLVAAALPLAPPFANASVSDVIQTAGYVAIGVQVGLRFTMASLRSIGALIPLALCTIALTLTASAGLAWVLVVTTGVAPLDAYLATTPGGIYAVMGTSETTGGDVTFVAAAQVVRLLLVLVSAPFLAVYLRRATDPIR